MAFGVIQTWYRNLRLPGRHDVGRKVDGLHQFDLQVGRALLIVYEQHIGTGNYAGDAGYRTIVNKVIYPGRHTVVIPGGTTSDIKNRTEADVVEFIVRIPDSYAELRAADIGRACLVQRDIIVVIRPILDGSVERFGQVRIAAKLPCCQVEIVATEGLQPVGLCCTASCQYGDSG